MSMAPMQTTLTAEDLAARFGAMPLWRIRSDPAPGIATEEDALRILDSEDRVCELVDGILVEKDAAAESSLLAAFLIEILGAFVRRHGLGFVLAPDAMLRLGIGRVRAPDVSFIRRDQLPSRRLPPGPIPDLYPTLAVEVLSPGNTKREMEEKLDDYFGAGCELVWIVDPVKKTVCVLPARVEEMTLTVADVLDGGTVVPGFTLPIVELFDALELPE